MSSMSSKLPMNSDLPMSVSYVALE
jgi:hypothetical protein